MSPKDLSKFSGNLDTSFQPESRFTPWGLQGERSNKVFQIPTNSSRIVNYSRGDSPTNVEIEAELEKSLKEIEKISPPELLPTIRPHNGSISGMDIMGEEGDKVIAPANGIVINTVWQSDYGHMIEIDHGNGLRTRYGHLSKMEVQVGDSIKRGEEIGLVGSTGMTSVPRLHYELIFKNFLIDPFRFVHPENLRSDGVN